MLLVDKITYIGKFVEIQPVFRIRNGFSTDPDPGFYLSTDPDPCGKTSVDPDLNQPCRPTKLWIFLHFFALLYASNKFKTHVT
jgi:hypothetical protein